MIIELTDKLAQKILTIGGGGAGGIVVGVKVGLNTSYVLTISLVQVMDIIIVAALTGGVGALVGWFVHLLLNYLKRVCIKRWSKNKEVKK